MPFSIAIIVLALIPDATIFGYGTNFLTLMTNIVLGLGGLAIMTVGIPFVSNLAIDKFFSVGDTLSILWYNAVMIATVGFNLGSAFSYYYYSDLLI
jgi:hypothetical protein